MSSRNIRSLAPLSVRVPRREDTFFPLADEDDVYGDGYDDEDCSYTLNLGAESEGPSACPTPARRPSLKSLQLAAALAPAVAVPSAWDQDDVAPSPIEHFEPEFGSPISDYSDSSFASFSSDSSWSSSTDAAPPSPTVSDSEDHTDYSFGALQATKALQTRRHAPHPLSSVLGVRGGLASVARVVGCVVVVAALAASGRWSGGGDAASHSGGYAPAAGM